MKSREKREAQGIITVSSLCGSGDVVNANARWNEFGKRWRAVLFQEGFDLECQSNNFQVLLESLRCVLLGLELNSGQRSTRSMTRQTGLCFVSAGPRTRERFKHISTPRIFCQGHGGVSQ